MRALLLAALAALLAGPVATAQGVSTPAGDLVATVEAGGEPLAVAHDPGASALPGDDRVYVAQTVRELGLAWQHAPADASAQAGLRGFRLETGAAAMLGAALADAGRAVPAGARAAWPWMGPGGVDVALDFRGLERTAGEEPVPWPAAWGGLGWGLGYDGLSLPAAFRGDSDDAVADQAYGVAYACAEFAEREGVHPPGCDRLGALATGLLPRLAFHSDLQDVGLGSRVHVAVPEPGVPRADGASVAVAGLGRASAPIDETPAALADAPRLASRGGPDLPGAPASPVPAATAQLAGVLPLGFAAGLPVAVAALALALAVPVWALYRRILPHRALLHPVREDLLLRVRAHPGIHESQLAREMGLRHTHVQYHLRVLSEAGILETRRFGGLKCIFELGRHSPAEKASAMTERGRSREVLLAVGASPGIAQRDLARQLGMSESSIKWHLDRLEGAGLVRTERARGAKRAWAEPGALALPPAAPVAVAEPAPVVPAWTPTAPL